MDYKTSGVDIEKANNLTQSIKNTVLSSNIGLFAGIYENNAFPGYCLTSCIDGIGTKIIPLLERELIETIAQDLVAANFNDLVCSGSKPLFFLDYFATNTIDTNLVEKFIKSLKKILDKYNCTLLGGETSELKGLIVDKRIDICGFTTGMVKKDKILRKENIEAEDIIVGLRSSGPHVNGFTLIRKLYEDKLLSEEDLVETLKPSYIYMDEILKLCGNSLIKACANITGGGIADNLARIIPADMQAEIFKDKIPPIKIFEKISRIIGEKESYKVFNMGAGMCIVVSPDNLDETLNICSKFEPFIFGRIMANEKSSGVWIR